MKKYFLCLLFVIGSASAGQEQLAPCSGDPKTWHKCIGTFKYPNRTYVGAWNNGNRSGYGEIKFVDGSKFIGQFKDDQPTGQGIHTFANGDQYIGQYTSGQRTGHGTYTYANGDQYVGQFKDGKYDGLGKGTHTTANGDKYVGEYKDGQVNEQGTYTFVNGDQYVGQFKDGKYDGQGAYTHANGDQYVGQFKNGKYDGLGAFISANGDQYVGEYRDGQATGQGTQTLVNGARYVGQFKDGKYDSRGAFTFTDGDQYEGEYKDGQATGQGTFTYANGDQYVGQFKDGKFDGQGAYTFSDERKYIGDFKNHARTGNGKYEGPGWTDYVGAMLEKKPTKFWYARKLDRATLLFQKQKFKEALPSLAQLARGNDPRAQGLLAGMYLYGLGTSIELESAYKWALEGANHQDAIAQNVLGLMFKKGLGVNKNLTEAFGWLKKSAENGNDDAQLSMAFGYIYGSAVEKNIVGGLEHLQASAERGNLQAMAALADEYYFGKNLTQNYPVAKHWYELAAKQSNTYSQIQLARIYWSGHGVPIDTAKAIQLYDAAAQKNNRYALTQLARIYQNGINVEENSELAHQYYFKLAQLNDATGQLKLALHILNDSDILNKDDAKHLLINSARKGNKVAKLHLLNLYSKANIKNLTNSKKIQNIKKIAHDYKQHNFEYKYLTEQKNSNPIKKAVAILNKSVERDENFKMSSAYAEEFEFAYEGLKKEIKSSSFLTDTQEKRDFLQMLIYKMSEIDNFYSDARKLSNSKDAKESRERLLLEIKSFSEHLINTYPKTHVLHAEGYQLSVHPYLDLPLSGKAVNLKKIIDYQKTDGYFAALVSDDNLTDEWLCRRYLHNVVDVTFLSFLIANGQPDKEDFSNKALDYLFDTALDHKECLNSDVENLIYSVTKQLESFSNDTDLHEFIATRQVERSKLNGESSFKQQHAYILLLRKQGNYEKARIYLNKLVEELLASEGTRFEQDALLFTANPTEYLIPVYLFNEQFLLAQEAITKAIKYSLARNYDPIDTSSALNSARQFPYLPSLLLDLLETIPENRATQKIFLLKKAFELDRSNFSFTSKFKSDEILGRIDLYNREIERKLIDLLLSQNRQVEAELFVKYLKLGEMSELLRDQSINEDFALPNWFYNPEETDLNQNYVRLLDRAQSVVKALGSLDFIKEKSIDSQSASQLEAFTRFLLTGESSESLINLINNKHDFAFIKDENQDLLAKLPKQTALIQYVISKNYLHINVNLQGKKITKKISISSKDLVNKIYQFRSALADRVSSIALGQELYSVLIKPIESDLNLDNTFQVMLSLDGALRYLPFAALHDGQSHLVSKYNFTIFDNLNTNDVFSSNNKWKVAGFGVTKAVNGFTALPSVMEEMTGIITNKTLGVYPGTIRLNENFTLKELQSSINNKYPVFHIATHFKFSPGAATDSYLQLGDGSTLNLSDFKKLSLSGVDLITFSACQTGLGGGTAENGVEIAGLSYIAQRNGAKTVIASLWSVSDKSTALLMSKMYGYMANKGLGKSRALRESQLDLMGSKDYSDPFYWAPFVLYGNWQ